MAQLTQLEATAHQTACKLLRKPDLTHLDRKLILEGYHEAATTVNSEIGAYFTPPGLTVDFAIEVSGTRVIDLGAGIGRLSWACAGPVFDHERGEMVERKLVCVEANADYCEVGERILPEAEWVCADVLNDDLSHLGEFDCAISNPPFGRRGLTGRGPRYKQADGEYCFIDVASDLADHGVFLIPQMSSPFQVSGRLERAEERPAIYERFEQATKIELEQGCAIDTAYYQREWHGVSPSVEIVVADFTEARERRRAQAGSKRPSPQTGLW